MDVWHAHSLRMLRKKQTSGNNRCELVEVLNWPANAKTSRFCATRVLLVCACLHLWNKHLSLVLDYNELIASKAALASSYLCNTQQLPFSLRWRYFFTSVTKLNRPDGTAVIVSHHGLWISLTWCCCCWTLDHTHWLKSSNRPVHPLNVLQICAQSLELFCIKHTYILWKKVIKMQS